ncbi:MAG TPA: alpha/beta hydrolase [Ktedonobacteraceae bacterium]|nr:alpha/beta hydrolase [Ktedonobacteraceae bacterium]
MSSTLIILLCIFILLLSLLVVACFYFYGVGIARKSQEFLIPTPDLQATDFTLPDMFDSAWVEKQPFEEVEMMSHDGLLLRGYFLPAQTPTNKTAILAHGYRGSGKRDMGAIARMYHERLNFNVLTPDLRGHGKSEGKYIGFGWPDRLDYLKWAAYVVQRVGQESQIVLHGISMGGSAVLMASGESLPEQVKCIVSDCPFTSVKAILIYQYRRMYKLPTFPIAPVTSLLCKLRAGYFFGEASTLLQVSKNTRPVLFIHGAEDTFVPTSMIHPLYDECQTYKEKWIVPQAGHGLSFHTDKEVYTQRVNEFLHKFVD